MADKVKAKSASLHCLLWELITWVSSFEDPKINIKGVRHTCGIEDKICHELVFENEHVGFIYNFDIRDKKALKGLNSVCCLWANKGKKSTTDYDEKDIFEIDDLSTINTG